MTKTYFQTLLSTYAMESLSFITFQKRLSDSSDLIPEEMTRTKKKAKLISKMYTQQNTEHHPCIATPGTITASSIYGDFACQNWCYLYGEVHAVTSEVIGVTESAWHR